MSKKDPLNLIITGVGGQGNVLMAQLIGKAMVKAGFCVTVGETYGPAQRGGAVMSHLRISKEADYSHLIPDGGADIVLGLEPIETLRVLTQYGNRMVDTITNTRPVYPIAVNAGEAEYPSMERMEELIRELSRQAWFMDAADIAISMEAPVVVTNIIMAGALIGAGLLPLTEEIFRQVLLESFPADKQEINLEAYKKGLDVMANKAHR